jgi:hypothetical protein
MEQVYDILISVYSPVILSYLIPLNNSESPVSACPKKVRLNHADKSVEATLGVIAIIQST